MLFILIIILIITGLLCIQFYYEGKLVKYFEQKQIDTGSVEDTDLKDAYEMTLINFNRFPSYKGEYTSLLFDNVFHIKIYSNYVILTIKTSLHGSYSIKMPKFKLLVKNDIFAGKLLNIKFDNYSLLFKFPNKMQNLLYENLIN